MAVDPPPPKETTSDCLKKGFPLDFVWQNNFDMDFPDFFYGILETPLLRNAQKHDKKNNKKQGGGGGGKKKRYVRTLFFVLAQMHVVFPFYVFCRPLSESALARARYLVWTI
jgi:hypothetical protein